MNILNALSQNSWLIVSLISWAIAQIIKVFVVLFTSRRFDFTRLVGSGGMPSSHSAFVCALATMTGLSEGFNSPLFAICTVFAFVVMYDAAGVRRSAGQQAAVLNRIVKNFKTADFKDTEKELKELLGHTPVQVIVGALLGIFVAIAYYKYF